VVGSDRDSNVRRHMSYGAEKNKLRVTIFLKGDFLLYMLKLATGDVGFLDCSLDECALLDKEKRHCLLEELMVEKN